MKSRGQAAYTTAYIFKVVGIKAYNRNLGMNFWFKNMRCAEFLREELGFHNLGMIDTGKKIRPNDDLTKLL